MKLDPTHKRKHSIMKHLHTISQKPHPAQTGVTTPLETIIILLMSTIFQGWDNLGPAISGLQKFYRKTP